MLCSAQRERTACCRSGFAATSTSSELALRSGGSWTYGSLDICGARACVAMHGLPRAVIVNGALTLNCVSMVEQPHGGSDRETSCHVVTRHGPPCIARFIADIPELMSRMPASMHMP